MAEWRYELQTNIGEVLNQLKTLQNRVDELENGKHQINLDIDSKKLEKVITNLDKMLESLGKGTGDFKEFENLSKELSSIVSEVQNLSKAFGKVDDSGTKTLLSSIQNIDKSLSELSQHIINVNKNMSNIGGDTNSAVKQVENISNAYDNAAKSAEKLADAQNKIDTDKSNISSVNSESENIKKQQQYYKNIANELVSIQDRHEGTHLIISEIGKSESELISTIIQENKEIAAGNELWKERQFYIDEYGKVTASYRGDKNEIGIGNAGNISIGNPVKETHIHPYNENGAGSYSIGDVYNMHLAFLQGIRQFELRWRDEVLSIDLTNIDPKSLLSMADSYEDFCAGVQKVMYDVYQIDQDFVFNRGQNLKNSYLANLIQDRGGSAKLYTQNFDGTKTQKDFLDISNAEQTLISTTGLYAIKLSELNEESEEYQRTAQYILNNRKDLVEYYQKMGLITSPEIDNDSLKNQIKLIDEFTIAFNEYISAYEDYYGRMNSDGDGFGLSKAKKTLSELEKSYPELKEVRSNGYVNYPDSELYDKALKKYLNRQEQLQSGLKQTQKQAEDTAESILKVTGYRGTNGGDPVTSNKSGATFWDSKKNVAGLYGTNSSDKTLWSSDLFFKNPLTIDAKNQKYGDITYLGDGIDETSKKIIELTNREKELRTSLQNSTESGQEQVNMALELQKVIREISDISKDMSNPYGTHSTDWFAEYAKQNGYDGVHLKNVLDTPDSYAKDNTEISDVFITFQREQLKNTTLLAKANKELAESEREVALAELGVVKNTDSQIKNPSQNNTESSPTTSASAITEESNALEKVSSSATEAANAKEKFSEANKEVKSSADASVPSVKKESDALDKVSKRSRSDADNIKLEQRARIYKELNSSLDRYAIVAGRVANGKTLSTDEEEMARLQVRIEELQNEPILSETQLELSRTKLEKIETSLENIQEKLQLKRIDSIQTSIDSYNKDYKSRVNGRPVEENRGKEYQQLLDKYKASIDALQAKKDELSKQPTISEDDLDSVKKMTEAVEKNKNALIAMSAAEKGSSEQSRRKEIDKITKYLKDNTRISEEAKTKLKEYLDLLRNGGADVNVDEIHNGFLKVTEAERLAGNEGKRFLDVIRDKAWYGWAAQIASYFSLQDIIRYFKEGATVVKEFDDGLTNISYTMDVTKSQLDGIGQSVLDLSKDLKSSIDDSMQVAKIYANMNTTAEEIKKLSEPTLIMSNLTGFDASTMADDIQAVTQQFEIAAEDSMHIADVYDTISKNIRVDYAKGIEAIAESVQVAGSTAKMAGLEFEDLAALTGKVVETTRLAGAQVGNGMKTIFTRLSRVGELSDEVDNETLSKASESLHQIGVEVYNADGSYRSFKTIMSELAAKWGDLTDAEKSNISFNVAATRQTNLLNAVLSNFSDSMELAEQATNSNGNALQNNEKYIDSMSGKLQNLENVGKTAWIHILDSEALKSGIDVLSMLIELLDTFVSKLGVIGTLGIGGGIAALIKNFAKTNQRLYFNSPTVLIG